MNSPPRDPFTYSTSPSSFLDICLYWPGTRSAHTKEKDGMYNSLGKKKRRGGLGEVTAAAQRRKIHRHCPSMDSHLYAAFAAPLLLQGKPRRK